MVEEEGREEEQEEEVGEPQEEARVHQLSTCPMMKQ